MSQQDSVFMRTLIIVMLSLFVLLVVIIIAAKIVAGDRTANTEPLVVAKIEQQIEPVGKVELAGSAPAAAGGKVDGAQVYQSTCFACHGTGAAGAPKAGDKAAWKPRIAQGVATLYGHALKGFKGMPMKGGNPSLADDAVKAAVDYLVTQGK